jgi:hypothetical protein
VSVLGKVCNRVTLDGRKAERNNIKTRGKHGYIKICTTGLITIIISLCNLSLPGPEI